MIYKEKNLPIKSLEEEGLAAYDIQFLTMRYVTYSPFG
jgi:hypothetical protein